MHLQLPCIRFIHMRGFGVLMVNQRREHEVVANAAQDEQHKGHGRAQAVQNEQLRVRVALKQDVDSQERALEINQRKAQVWPLDDAHDKQSDVEADEPGHQEHDHDQRDDGIHRVPFLPCLVPVGWLGVLQHRTHKANVYVLEDHSQEDHREAESGNGNRCTKGKCRACVVEGQLLPPLRVGVWRWWVDFVVICVPKPYICCN
mmetsp:Transcript_59259/g.130047  ORF Transcript_59259/g.130047 Transcript_59259/m.130047 type:complete len:203 (+) Transcript_59259:378-986(+)